MKKILLILLFTLSFGVVHADGCDALFTREAAQFIKDIVTLVRIAVPILLIVLCSSDFVSIVTGQDEKVTKTAISRIIKRFICAAAFFFVPLILQLILGIDAVNNALNLVDDPSCGIDGDLDGYKSEEEIQKETEERLEEERKKKEEEEKKKKEEEEKKKQEEEAKKEEESNKDEDDDGSQEPSDGNSDNISKDHPSKAVTANISKNYYKNFTYYLYLPDKVTKNLPIVLYMPGLGERGNDYFNNAKTGITWGPINEVYRHGYKYNAIIVVAQVPSGQSAYQYVDNYVKLLNDIADEYDANKNKISVMGFSHGCYGILTLIKKYPKYFSAVVPVGCNTTNGNVSSFVNQPVWTFVGGGDGYNQMPKFVEQINQQGGNAKHTYVTDLNGKAVNAHNVFNNDYSILRDKKYNVINWMIAQRKS